MEPTQPSQRPAHPARHTGPTKEDSRPGTVAFRGLLDGLLALVSTEQQGVARGIAKELQALFTGLEQKGHYKKSSEVLTVTHLQKAVTEAVQAAIAPSKGVVQGRSWATVAAGGPVLNPLNQPTKAIPPRINRELLIRGTNLPADLAKRTPAETIQAINQVSAKKGAIAARKLPSGDVVVTFSDSTTKGWHSQNTQWIQQAFGEQAKEAYRTYAILVKGLKKADLQGITEEAFGIEIGLQSVDKVKFRLPTNPGFTRATVLVTLESQEEAQKACNQGVVWNAQILDCEPYWATLEPKQCFKCWKWGHIQRFCRKEALCGMCGTGAHGEGGRAGEALCPTKQGRVPCKCPCCGGDHAAWAKECPGRVKAKEEARQAYQYRPRAFEPAPTVATEPTAASRPIFTFGKAQTQDEEGFQRVGAKRPRLARGRPTLISVAGRDPSQSRISLGTGSTIFGASQPTQPTQPTQPAEQAQPAEDIAMESNEN